MNIKYNKEYWFYIEPYIYMNVKEDKALLLNMLDWNEIIVKNEKILVLLKQLLIAEHGGVLYLDKLNYQEIKNELNILRDNFFCDIIPVALTEAKPIQFIPQINIINDILCKSKVFNRSRRELRLLATEANLFLSTQCSVDLQCTRYKNYQEQIICCVNNSNTYSLSTLINILQKLIISDIKYINLLGLHSLSCEEQKQILHLVNKSSKKYGLIINACSNFLPDTEEINFNGDYKIIVDLHSLSYKEIRTYFNKIIKYSNIQIFKYFF